MPIVQISRIQHRRGQATDLPQLAAGELGWVVDTQRLYIGNGTVADGAPNVGNTEILTGASTGFSTVVNYTYQGYLGSDTPILTGAATDIQRTLQQRLDDYVSVKAFGALGDGSTADGPAIQRAIDELYSDVVDQDNPRSRRILFFPAGQYNIATSLTIPPFAHLKGEGPGKTIIYQAGGNAPVAVTEDDDGNVYNSIGTSSATVPTYIELDGICFKNGEAYGGLSIDCATYVYVRNCKFMGTYTVSTPPADSSLTGYFPNSTGITIRSTTALPCSNILFDQCIFTKFARLVDISHDATSISFSNCDFNTAYYGAVVGERVDGSTDGLTLGPKDVKIINSSFATIARNGVYVLPQSSRADGTIGEVRHFVSFANYFAKDVGTEFDGVNSVNVWPALQFDADECQSIADYFDNTQRRSTSLNPIPQIQGIGIQTDTTKQITLAHNTSVAAATEIRLPALNGKSIIINYKMERGATFRVGQFIVNASTTLVTYDDTFNENGATSVGVTLSAVLDALDSTAGNETVIVKFTSTASPSTSITMDYQITHFA